MSWDAAQLRILRELGLEPLLLAGSVREPGAGAAFARGPDVARNEGQSRQGADAPRAPGGPAKLQAALLHAAGGRDISALAFDLERLRHEPALKRALWPSLRALRRGH